MEEKGFDKINVPETIPLGDLDVTILPLEHYLLIVYYQRNFYPGFVPVKEHLSVDVQYPVEHVYLFCRAKSAVVVVKTHHQSFLLHLTYQDTYHLKDTLELDMYTLSTLEGVPIQHARTIKYTPSYCPSELILSQLELPAHIADLHLATSPPFPTVPYVFRPAIQSKKDKDFHLLRQDALRKARDDVLQYAKYGVSKKDLLGTLQSHVDTSDCAYVSHLDSFGPFQSVDDMLDGHEEIDLSRVAMVDIQDMAPMLKPGNQRAAWIREALTLSATTYGTDLSPESDDQPRYLGNNTPLNVSLSARALASFWQPGLPAENEVSFEPDMTVGPAGLFPTVEDVAKETQNPAATETIAQTGEEELMIPAVVETAGKRKRRGEIPASQPRPEASSFPTDTQENIPASMPTESLSQDVLSMPSSLDDVPATQPVMGKFAERPKPKKTKSKKKPRLRGFK